MCYKVNYAHYTISTYYAFSYMCISAVKSACLLHKPSKLFARPLSRTPASPPSPPNFFQVRAAVAFSSSGTLKVWLVLCHERRKKQREEGLLPRRCRWGDRDAHLLLRRSVTVESQLFKMYAFLICLYIIHTAWLKKNGSDFPLCKLFLKNTICFLKSKKRLMAATMQ